MCETLLNEYNCFQAETHSQHEIFLRTKKEKKREAHFNSFNYNFILFHFLSSTFFSVFTSYLLLLLVIMNL